MKKDWEIKKLKDICEKGSSNVNMKDLLNLGGNYPIYGASGFIQNVNFYHQEKEYIGIIKDGSGIGRTMLLPAKSSVIGTLQYILPKEGNSIHFINYALQSLDLSKYKQGAAIPHIYFRDYGETELVVPPLEEQKRIVKILDEKFAHLETIKTNAQTNLQNAKDLFQSQLTKAFMEESNPSTCEEGGASLQTSHLPQHALKWEKKRLGDCTSIIGDGLHGTPKYDENGNYYFINGSNLTITDIVFTPETKRVNETEYQKYKVELNENTVFLSINGSTLGKRTAFYNNEPVILGKSACYINVKSNTLNKYFLRHFLSSDIFQEYAWKEKTGAAIPNLGLKAMRDLKIPLPPLPEQKRIVKELDTLSEKVRQLQEIYTKQIADCDELKQSLLQKAFTGEL